MQNLSYKNLLELKNKKQCLETIISIDKLTHQYAWEYTAWQQAFNDSQYIIELILFTNIIIGSSVWLKNQTAYELIHIFIDKAYQNQGLASKWLIYLCNRFIQQNYQIWLEVRSSNIIAQKLYKKCGFEIVGKRKNYYPIYQNNIIINREDALLMQK